MIVVRTKKTIPNMRSYVNTTIALTVKILLKLGVMKTKANQAADRFPDTADNALRKANFVLVTKIF